MAIILAIVAAAELPGAQDLNSAARSDPHFQPALVGLAILAVALVAFLTFDFYRQKSRERQERRKLERFREKQLSRNAASNVDPKTPR
jgi:hypothetical protein